MRASGRSRGSVPGRMKVTTLNLMTTYRSEALATRAFFLIDRKYSDNNAIDPLGSPNAELFSLRCFERGSCCRWRVEAIPRHRRERGDGPIPRRRKAWPVAAG